MKKIALFLALGLFIVTTLSGQDIHLSQYDASPIIQNPANTGVDKNMKYRIVNQYRNQWDAVAYKSFISTALAYDMPLKEKWGVGGYVLNDNSSRVFNSFNFTLSGSHDIAMGNQDKHHLLIGLQAGIIHKKMRTGNYSFDSQYSDGSFDTDLPSNEVFEKEVRLMPEVNMGFAYMNTDKSLRYNPYGGLSLSHITNPRENFMSEGYESRLPLKYIIQGGCKITIKEGFLLDPAIMIMRQRNVNELNFGLRSFNEIKGADLTLISGLQYRLNDAVIGHIGVFYRNFIYRISYDLNVSPLSKFSNYRGGLEFSLTFFKTINRGGSSYSGS